MSTAQCVISIDSLSYGGSGVGRRDDGKVVFVPLVLPGERVRVSVQREHKGYIEARMEDLLESSPWRVDPLCQYFPECGGCDWQHIAYAHQISQKQKIIEEQLERKGIPVAMMEEPVHSSREIGYRCHAMVRCSLSGEFKCGFFRKQTNTIVPVEKCLILNDHSQDVIDRIRDVLGANPLFGLDSLEIHAPSDEVLVRTFLQGPAQRELLGRLHFMQRSMGLKGLSCMFQGGRGREFIFGDSSCSYEMSIRGRGIAFASSFGGFIQANLEVNRCLVEEVLDKASGSGTVLDLYSGSGNFGIPLSMYGEQVVAVEQDTMLMETGKTLARKNGCQGIRFFRDDAARAVKRLNREGKSFNTVVLDPPREGAREVARLLCHMKSDKIIYISCNPSTLARDLAELVQGGFSVKSVRIFDMFPQTYHIESITVLER